MFSKRFFFIVGLILLFLGLATLVFLFFLRPSPGVAPTVPGKTVEGEPTELPLGLVGAPSGVALSVTRPFSTRLQASPTAQGGLTETLRLTASAVDAITLGSDGKSITYFDPSDGRFYAISPSGQITTLTDQTFRSASDIRWDSAGQKALMEFPDGSNILYDFSTQEQTTLPSHWEDFNFDPDGTAVIAKSLGNDPEANALVISNADASQTKIVAALGKNPERVDVSWSPNDQIVAFAESGSLQTGFGRQMILPIGKNEENYPGLVVEGTNFHSRWSPSGARLLYDVSGSTSDFKPLLWIVDATPATMGEHRLSLEINTWADQCVFADEATLYCAVPVLLPKNAGLQRELSSASDDALYRVDLSSGKTSIVGFPEIATHMSNLILSEDGSVVYFLDSRSRLQQMRLK